ncbi:type II toxin-antitoxin system HipA family toxin [Polaromonas sp. CG_9.11]|uniref:type II toxin-antitoxin system HipA family toxin n=1 Tax=Polaromonas sp. CG_9.11 TaxID=2787730 RepID=UPI0018C95A8A|nr:type II toxin-antitoxin system HipA family toxin [Polaromonas sp. CG_9.11]MBG6075365.1 serine/threonine-protein kinase HipA [Polaromonas sp. CG_9.11]
MPKQLTVWLFGRLVGTLAQIDGRLGFSYAPEWLAQTDAVPMSQSLPLQPDPFDDRATRPFFAGLLPEGDMRKLVAQALHVSRQNDFALLDGIGGECAGAVTLLEPGQTPQVGVTEDAVRWLVNADLISVLDDMPRRPMLAGEQDMRLSLAGAQDKLPVVVRLESGVVQIGLPRFGSPSTHILKPAIPGIEGSVFNEGFCMALARALKLDVANAVIHHIEEDPQQRQFLLVERYDRQHAQADSAIHSTTLSVRLHQEDFCQALGFPPETKYQNEGGPDLAQAFELLRRATRPSAPSTLRLLDFVIFNALVGNHDAHSKNFSLLYTPQGALLTGSLAPLYDVLCTAVYPGLTDKMAMKIGSKYKFSEVQARHWTQFATDAQLSPALVKKRILDIAKRLPDLALATEKVLEEQGNGHPIVGQIVTLIDQRCALTIRRLTATGADEPEHDAPGGTS